MNAFGQKLKEIREAKGFTQPELAKASGVPQASISRYEQGERTPASDALFAICRALGVSCSRFKDCF